MSAVERAAEVIRDAYRCRHLGQTWGPYPAAVALAEAGLLVTDEARGVPLFDAETFGASVRARRAAAGLTVRAAAVVTGVPFGTLNRIEHGGTPSVETFLRLKAWVLSS